MIEALQAQLEAFDRPALYEPGNFRERAEAIEAIQSDIVDQIDDWLAYPTHARALHALRDAADGMLQRLLAVDELVFETLRAAIRAGDRGAALQERIERLAGRRDASGRDVFGYDRLDRLVTGVLDMDEFPEPSLEPEPGMVLNQSTPARLIVELVERLQPGPGDVFYDLGSGIGQVTMLVHLLGNMPARGIEFEPAFCAYARTRAAALGLAQVEFVNADARHASYAQGTIFYMYTPFEGAMLLAVLERLRERSLNGPITLATYGACTPIVARQHWLSAPDPIEPGSYRLAFFRSR